MLGKEILNEKETKKKAYRNLKLLLTYVYG